MHASSPKPGVRTRSAVSSTSNRPQSSGGNSEKSNQDPIETPPELIEADNFGKDDS